MALRKIYIRFREDVPDNTDCYAALDGFRQLGVEVKPFYGFGDIYLIDDLGPEIGLHGFVGDVHAALSGCLKKRIPPPLDYPGSLKGFLGREVSLTSLGSIRARPIGDRVFIKPVQHKLFTGFVWDGGEAARRSIITLENTTPIWMSEEVEFVAEFRVFVLDNEILDVCRYNGLWDECPPRAGKVRRAINAYDLEAHPRAYALDFGVTATGDYLLVEVNDSYALGHYGMDPIKYAKMIEARWEELVK